MGDTLQIPRVKWTGRVREVTLGATAEEGGTRGRTVTVGGETGLPFLHFETEMPHRPALAVQVMSRPPHEWSPPLQDAWGEATQDPGAWAKAAEEARADLVLLTLTLEDSTGDARSALRGVLAATELPVLVFGPGQVEADNELLVSVAEEGKGERLALGVCEEKNYRTIVAAAMAHGHLVVSRTPMDVNLAKQLIILIHDTGMPLERILMDPTTGALGYGIEYGYSVMERLRIAALQGDAMTQQPMLVTPGEEAWKTKEAKVGEGVPDAWGKWEGRAVNWEIATAAALVESGANVLVLRHPDSVRNVGWMIEELLKSPERIAEQHSASLQ